MAKKSEKQYGQKPRKGAQKRSLAKIAKKWPKKRRNNMGKALKMAPKKPVPYSDHT